MFYLWACDLKKRKCQDSIISISNFYGLVWVQLCVCFHCCVVLNCDDAFFRMKYAFHFYELKNIFLGWRSSFFQNNFNSMALANVHKCDTLKFLTSLNRKKFFASVSHWATMMSLKTLNLPKMFIWKLTGQVVDLNFKEGDLSTKRRESCNFLVCWRRESVCNVIL